MKTYWIRPLAMAVTIACAQEKPAPGDRLVLSDGWTLSRDGASQRYDASVPSTVAGVTGSASFPTYFVRTTLPSAPVS